eukprot:PhM_4_TR12315/c0_g1_i1/m.53228
MLLFRKAERSVFLCSSPMKGFCIRLSFFKEMASCSSFSSEFPGTPPSNKTLVTCDSAASDLERQADLLASERATTRHLRHVMEALEAELDDTRLQLRSLQTAYSRLLEQQQQSTQWSLRLGDNNNVGTACSSLEAITPQRSCRTFTTVCSPGVLDIAPRGVSLALSEVEMRTIPTQSVERSEECDNDNVDGLRRVVRIQQQELEELRAFHSEVHRRASSVSGGEFSPLFSSAQRAIFESARSSGPMPMFGDVADELCPLSVSSSVLGGTLPAVSHCRRGSLGNTGG